MSVNITCQEEERRKSGAYVEPKDGTKQRKAGEERRCKEV